MLALLKRERALRWVPLACLFAAAVPALVFELAGAEQVVTVPEPVGDGPEVMLGGRVGSFLDTSLTYSLTMLLVLQLSVMLSLRLVSLQTRILESERSLPISARSIIFQRLATAWIVLVLPCLAVTALMATSLTAPHQLQELGRLTARTVLHLTLAVLILFAYRPRRVKLHVIELVAVGLAGLAVAMLPILLDSTTSDAPAAILVVVLAALLWTRLADWTPVDDPAIAAPDEAAARAPLPVRVFGPLRWTFLRSTVLRPVAIVTTVLAVLMLSLADRQMSFVLIWFPAIFVFTGLQMGFNLLHGIDSFPIRRRRLLRFIALPSLIVLIVAAGFRSTQTVGYRSYEILSGDVMLDRLSVDTLTVDAEYATHVRVPPSLWRIASTAQEAHIVAPWGEAHDPLQHPVFWGATTFAYSPYGVQPENSGRFLMWQISRALTAVHGFEGTLEDVHEAWFPDVNLDNAIFSLRLHDADAGDWGFATAEPPGTPNTLGFGILCATLTWIIIAAYCLRPNMPPRSGALWLHLLRRQFTGGLVLFGLIMLIQGMQGADRALLPVLWAQFHGTLDGALGSSSLLWTALVLSVAGAGYAFLVWRIERLEVPPLMVSGWTKKAMPIY